jgi:hypothetical protein
VHKNLFPCGVSYGAAELDWTLSHGADDIHVEFGRDLEGEPVAQIDMLSGDVDVRLGLTGSHFI